MYHGSMEQTMEQTEPANMINIRDLTIRCGRCQSCQSLVKFAPADGFNIYTYECENDQCPPAETRTLLEVPVVLDQFAQRHPESDCDGGCGG
jgi:hypothetical protein